MAPVDELDLNPEEVRVLGCLIEKAYTTPENYPLSTNALLTACNQKTNREPVVDYETRTVVQTMLSLRQRGLARTITGGTRVEKHRHVVDEKLGLDDEEASVLAVLLLRGAQTTTEIKTRTERYVSFLSVTAVDEVLAQLLGREEPLVVNVGRGYGQTQERWMHLVGDEEIEPDTWEPPAPTARSGSGASRTQLVNRELEDRIGRLEARMARLESELGLTDEPEAGGG
jgi:uncharacterized protein YceH (UPF0502 family)